MTDPLFFICSHDGCNKTFKRRDRLDIHTRTHTGERPYVCHFTGCTSSYVRSQHLSRHIDRVHGEGYKDFIKVRCPECQLELANTSSLSKHIRSFHDLDNRSKTYKCPEEGCSECFHKKKQLVVHRLQHADHLSLAVRCHQCPHEGCGKTFTFPNKLKRHLKVHQGYPCDTEGCGQILPNWSSLRKHKAVDHAPSHSCRECGAVFKQKSNLKQHVKVHSETVDLLPCPRENCGRTFYYRKNLTQHIKEYHNGETIWKNRCRQTSEPQKKRTSRKKKTMAAHLCGVDKNGNVVPKRRHIDEDVIRMEQRSSDTALADTHCVTNHDGHSLTASDLKVTSDHSSLVNYFWDKCDHSVTASDSTKETSDHSLITSHLSATNNIEHSDCEEPLKSICQDENTAARVEEVVHVSEDNISSASLPQQLLQNVKCRNLCHMSLQESVSASTVTIVIEDQDRSTEEVIVTVVS